jgi:hypothetical protein
MSYALSTTVGPLSSGTRGTLHTADELSKGEHVFVPHFDRSTGVTVTGAEVVKLRDRTRVYAQPNRSERRTINRRAAEVLANLRNNG